MSSPALTVRVVIPHYFHEHRDRSGYGSGLPGARGARCLALGRCLAGLLALCRNEEDLVLNIGKRCLETSGPQQRGDLNLLTVELDVHLFTCGEAVLSEVVDQFAGTICRHKLELDDPRQLPLAARNFLIQAEPSPDLALYMEDDLVIGDPLFIDKQNWFLNGTGGKMVLMPHRYEIIPGRKGQRLLVDGPLRDELIQRFTQPRLGIGNGHFWNGEEVVFDRTANPHSGMFCVNRKQLEHMRQKPLPNTGFVGPLETAATLSVMKYFHVLKPSWKHRGFLWIEHGHPSFISYASRWKLEVTKANENEGG